MNRRRFLQCLGLAPVAVPAALSAVPALTIPFTVRQYQLKSLEWFQTSRVMYYSPEYLAKLEEILEHNHASYLRGFRQ